MTTCSKPCAHSVLQSEVIDKQVAIRCSHCGALIGESRLGDGYELRATGAWLAAFEFADISKPARPAYPQSGPLDIRAAHQRVNAQLPKVLAKLAE